MIASSATSQGRRNRGSRVSGCSPNFFGGRGSSALPPSGSCRCDTDGDDYLQAEVTSIRLFLLCTKLTAPLSLLHSKYQRYQNNVRLCLVASVRSATTANSRTAQKMCAPVLKCHQLQGAGDLSPGPPLGALPPDPPYGLVLPRSPERPTLLLPQLQTTSDALPPLDGASRMRTSITIVHCIHRS